MQIEQLKTNNFDYPNFKMIQLSKIEQENATKLLNQIATGTIEAKENKLKNDILKIFDKHLKKEAYLKTKSSNFYSRKDFLQNIYLCFFEKIEELKKNGTISLTTLCNTINDIK